MRSQPYLLALLLLLSTGTSLEGQASFSGGYSRQHLAAGRHSGGISGYAFDMAVRVGRRVDLIFGAEDLEHEADARNAERNLSTFHAGLHLVAARHRMIDLGLATGFGLFGLDVDSEDDNGGGFAGFVQARVNIHPLPVVGFYVGGIMQALSAIGMGGGGTSYGLTFGVQLRSDGW
jgi:hypothetical protein